MRLFRLALATLLAGLPITGVAAPRRIELQPPASEVSFRAYGLGLLPLDAQFTRFRGWLSYDPADRAACQVELTAEVASVTMSDSSMRETVIGPDFMDAAAFPSLVYRGACRPDGVGGELGLHGVTRPFALTLDWEAGRVIATGQLRRAEWDMTAKPILVGQTIRIQVSIPLAGQDRAEGTR